MAGPNENCPSAWMLIAKQLQTHLWKEINRNVIITHFLLYSKVCGKIIAYTRYGGTDAFRNFNNNPNFILGQPLLIVPYCLVIH